MPVQILDLAGNRLPHQAELNTNVTQRRTAEYGLEQVVVDTVADTFDIFQAQGAFFEVFFHQRFVFLRDSFDHLGTQFFAAFFVSGTRARLLLTFFAFEGVVFFVNQIHDTFGVRLLDTAEELGYHPGALRFDQQR